MSFDTIPKDLRGLRACLVCSLIKVSVADFITNAEINKISFSRQWNNLSSMDVTTARRF